MSNSCINIRFFYWHLMISKGFSSIKIEKNEYWAEKGLKGVKKIEICECKF